MITKESQHKSANRLRRVNRTRVRLQGNTDRPRLNVTISLYQVSAQIIDDSQSKTLCSATSLGQKSLAKSTMTEKASWVGETIAKLAIAKKVKQVVFDRGAKRYHGRVAALATAARKSGLEF